jgi:hypothetical protein
LRIGRKIFNHLIRVEWFLFIVSLFFLLTITSNG